MKKTTLLAATAYGKVRNNTPEIVLLPWGATEPHNYHLPYGTDTFQSVAISETAAELAVQQGTACSVLPAIPYGVNTTQMQFPMTVNMNPTTQSAVLKDIIVSLNFHRISKLLIINGHGGNDFKPAIRELYGQFPEFSVAVIDWWKIPTKKSYFSEPGDHAGELETSLMLYLHPELVLPKEQWGEGKENKPLIPGFKEGWVWSPRPWEKISKDSGVGNPQFATMEKGKDYFEEITQKIAEVICGFAKTKKDNMYERIEE